MVKVSLGAIALSMIIICTPSAIVADTARDASSRNSLEWFLDDLGALFGKVAERATPKQTTSPKNVQVVEQPMPAPLEQAAQATETANPLVAIFDALAAFFAANPPSLVVENAGTPAPLPAGTPAPLPAKAAEPQTQPAAATPADTADTADMIESENLRDADTPKNPLSWLMADIGALLNGNATATPKTAPETTPAVETVATPIAEPTVPSEKKNNAIAAPAPKRDPLSWFLADIGALFGARDSAPPKNTSDAKPTITTADAQTAPQAPTPSPDTTVKAPQQTATLTTAPWQQPVGRDMFDPNVALFDVEGDTAPKASPQQAVASLPPAAPAPQIRRRPATSPTERNYANLGRNHKAVSPDPDEPNLMGDIFARLLGPSDNDVDAMVEAEQTSEPLANKISGRIVAEERLNLADTAPDAGTTPAATIERLRETKLRNIDLYVGHDTVIGTHYDAKQFGPEDCIERPLHGSIFCLSTLHWPAEIVEKFAVDTAFTLPGEALIRYENGAISRVYTVFDSQSFADVVKYMQRTFGPPSEREIIWMPVMEAPKLPNTTFRWKALSADRKNTMILEVRNYDDLRRSFADMDHGMVRLYREGSRPIFKHISTMDLMLMQRKRISQAPMASNAQAAQ